MMCATKAESGFDDELAMLVGTGSRRILAARTNGAMIILGIEAFGTEVCCGGWLLEAWAARGMMSRNTATSFFWLRC